MGCLPPSPRTLLQLNGGQHSAPATSRHTIPTLSLSLHIRRKLMENSIVEGNRHKAG